MIVDLFAPEEITRHPLNGIRMRRTSTRYKVNNPAVFVALVIMNVAGEYHEAETGLGLALLKHFCYMLFRRSRRVAATKHFRIGGTGVGRMVEHEKHKVNVRRNTIQFAGQPSALWSGHLVESGIEHQRECIGCAYGVVAAIIKIREALEVVAQSN